jgi:putative Holliday junction resolvase
LNEVTGTPAGSLLALDFGLRRIGLATASAITGTATPLTTIAADNGEPDWTRLDAVIADWQPGRLVVGLPFSADGSEADMTTRARAFADALVARYGIPLSLMDERYTSTEAEARLRQQRRTGLRTKRIKKTDVDSLAAAIIAESWLRNRSDES